MNKAQISQTVAAVVGLLTAATAHAAFIPVDSGPAGTTIGIVSNNDFKNALLSYDVKDFTLGASLGVAEAGTVDYYYYGKEARYRNDFIAGDLSHSSSYTPQTQNYFATPIQIGSLAVDAGLLNFGFCAYSGGVSPLGCINNAQNDLLGLNALQSIAFSIVGNSAWLFWDDSGAGPDDDHDDMLIRAVFTPTSVPEPGTLALFGVGVLGLMFGARRKQLRA